MGLHDLTAKDASELWGISRQSISAWRQEQSSPSASRMLLVSNFFDVTANRLAFATFGELLENELADKARFERVEAKIGRPTLKAVPEPADIVPLNRDDADE
jgi:transcriptional regulator with XRE-family HTH domain